MSRKVRIAAGFAFVLILVGTSYIMSGQSTARTYSEIDVFGAMVAAKDLPSQQFDAF